MSNDRYNQTEFLRQISETFSNFPLQSANDFENEIQDFVYVKSEPDTGKEHRPKRQVAEFPEDIDRDIENKKKELDTKSKNNTDGEVSYFFTNITSTQTFFVLTNLRHYSTYQIFLRACREKSPEENKIEGLEEQCGPDTPISITTQKKEENDLIPFFEAIKVPSNGSLGSIKVRWEAPPKPNGMLLSKCSIRNVSS